MLALIVAVQQRLVNSCDAGIEHSGMKSHHRAFFQNGCMIDRFSSVATPGERPVAGHENSRNGHRIQFTFAESLNDDLAGDPLDRKSVV